MYTLKGRYIELAVSLLFTLSYGELFGQQQQQQQQRYNPAVPPLPWHLAPPWEYIVREIILKSVIPSPADANAPHRRPLDVSFYGGPVAVYSSDDVNVILSRGNVYHLLNGHWMLCQDGCVDCEPCVAQRNPSFKWVLRKVKRLPAADPPWHDLQLTIMPQTEGRFHASNLWPNSYAYVTFLGEGATLPVARTHRDDDSNFPASLENSFSRQHHRSRNPLRLAERDSSAAEDKLPRHGDRPNVLENASTEKTQQEEAPGQMHGSQNTRRLRPQARPAEKAATSSSRLAHDFVDDEIVANGGETDPLAPKLILGVDQRGHRHLVHVVPMESSSATAHPPIPFVPHRPTSTQFAAGRAAHSNKTISERDRQTWVGILRRLFDSLNTHRRSIENFLESPADNTNGRGVSSPGSNTEVAEFVQNNREDRTNVDLEAATRLDAASSSSFQAPAENARVETHREYERRRDYEDVRQDSNGYYTEYRNRNLAKVLDGQIVASLDRGRERRRIRVKPYFVHGTRQNTPGINRSISSQGSADYSAAGSGNGLVTKSAKQIDLNDTLVGRASTPANNDSIESGSITTNRKREQLFTSESLESGNANRDFEVSHQPFRIIVTTESLGIPGEHETPNRTDYTLRVTTSETLAHSSQMDIDDKK